MNGEEAVGNGVRLQSVSFVQAQTKCGTMMHKITNTCKKFCSRFDIKFITVDVANAYLKTLWILLNV